MQALDGNECLLTVGIHGLKVVGNLADNAGKLQTAVHNQPTVGLDERAGEFASDPGLPLDQFAASLRVSLSFVHATCHIGDFCKGTIERVVVSIRFGGRRADKLFQLKVNQRCISLLVTVCLPEDDTGESAGQVTGDNLPSSTESDVGVFGTVSKAA